MKPSFSSVEQVQVHRVPVPEGTIAERVEDILPDSETDKCFAEST
jgi:hypothetical protein